MTATPRPWKVVDRKHSIVVAAVSDQTGDIVFTIDKDYDHAMGDAALIVKCVNVLDQHEQIVKELVRFVEHYENKEGQLGNGYARTFFDKAKDLLFNLGAPVVKD